MDWHFIYNKSRSWHDWQIELIHHIQLDNSYCLFAHLALCIHVSNFDVIQRCIWHRKWHLFCIYVACNSRNLGYGEASNRLIRLDFCKCSIYIWSSRCNSHWRKCTCIAFLDLQIVYWGLLFGRCLVVDDFEITNQYEFVCQGVRRLGVWYHSPKKPYNKRYFNQLGMLRNGFNELILLRKKFLETSRIGYSKTSKVKQGGVCVADDGCGVAHSV